MTPANLLYFITNDMRMSADYQPRVILYLLKQHNYGQELKILANHIMPTIGVNAAVTKCKNMPFKVLRSHDVLSHNDIWISLNLWPRPTKSEMRELRKACREKINEFQLRKK